MYIMLLQIGRSLFWDINENEPLTGGVALARGGFMSGVLGWRPYLNIDGKISTLVDTFYFYCK